jgi:hypothetical protein
LKLRFPTETSKNLAIGIAILIALSSIMAYHVAAASNDPYTPIYLPPGQITMQVANGTSSYFATTLYNVPSGYNVTNGTYLGWCVDKTALMTRDNQFPATLYSSLNLTGNLANENWTMVNYILNHKQGTNLTQIQDAIWYFINLSNGNIAPPGDETYAWTMINDAKANGTGFIPQDGQIVAIVCQPQTGLQQNVQISIIETPTNLIPEFPTMAIPLLALGALSLVIICRKKAIHAPSEKKTLT